MPTGLPDEPRPRSLLPLVRAAADPLDAALELQVEVLQAGAAAELRDVPQRVGLADLDAQDVDAPERRSGVDDGVDDDMRVMVLRLAHVSRVAARAQLGIPTTP